MCLWLNGPGDWCTLRIEDFEFINKDIWLQVSLKWVYCSHFSNCQHTRLSQSGWFVKCGFNFSPLDSSGTCLVCFLQPKSWFGCPCERITKHQGLKSWQFSTSVIWTRISPWDIKQSITYHTAAKTVRKPRLTCYLSICIAMLLHFDILY